MRQPHSKSAKPICSIDVTASASVMFALVAMFLLPATVVIDSPRDAAHVAVDLPKISKAAELRGALREDALLVAVQRDGHIWLETDHFIVLNSYLQTEQGAPRVLDFTAAHRDAASCLRALYVGHLALNGFGFRRRKSTRITYW